MSKYIIDNRSDKSDSTVVKQISSLIGQHERKIKRDEDAVTILNKGGGIATVKSLNLRFETVINDKSVRIVAMNENQPEEGSVE